MFRHVHNEIVRLRERGREREEERACSFYAFSKIHTIPLCVSSAFTVLSLNRTFSRREPQEADREAPQDRKKISIEIPGFNKFNFRMGDAG